MKPLAIFLGLLRIPLDFLMGILAFLLAYQLRTIDDFIPGLHLSLDLTSFPALADYLTFSYVATFILVILLAFNKMYPLKTGMRLSKEIGKIIITAMAWFGLIMGYYFVIRAFPFSRLALIYAWVLTIIFIISGRILVRALHRLLLHWGFDKKKVLFIGNNPITETLSQRMNKDAKLKLVGLVDDHYKKTTSLKNLGTLKELAKIIKKYGIEEIVQTKSDLSAHQSAEVLDLCREHHINYCFVPDLLAVQQTNIEVVTIAGIPIIHLKPTPLDGWGRVTKRAFDLIVASVSLIILSPLFALTALCIKLDSKGAIFFTHLDDGSRAKRVGQFGKLFPFYKFRTMYEKTDSLRYTTLSSHNTREGSPLVKIKNDPRVTKIGRILRKTSIDELPQLFSVISGKMSLVGPRPHLPEEVAKYEKHHKFVLTIKPGITGLAQISGRSDLDFEEEVRLDTFYIEHWSLWLDLKILLKTWSVIFKDYEE